MLFIALILFSLLCLVEAKLESIYIALKDQSTALPNYATLNAQEHEWSAIYYLFIVSLFCGIVAWAARVPVISIVTLYVCLIICRRIFFDYGLKIFRKRKIKAIEGDQKIDTALRKLFGANGGYTELVADLVLLIGFIYITIKI